MYELRGSSELLHLLEIIKSTTTIFFAIATAAATIYSFIDKDGKTALNLLIDKYQRNDESHSYISYCIASSIFDKMICQDSKKISLIKVFLLLIIFTFVYCVILYTNIEISSENKESFYNWIYYEILSKNPSMMVASFFLTFISLWLSLTQTKFFVSLYKYATKKIEVLYLLSADIFVSSAFFAFNAAISVIVILLIYNGTYKSELKILLDYSEVPGETRIVDLIILDTNNMEGDHPGTSSGFNIGDKLEIKDFIDYLEKTDSKLTEVKCSDFKSDWPSDYTGDIICGIVKLREPFGKIDRTILAKWSVSVGVNSILEFGGRGFVVLMKFFPSSALPVFVERENTESWVPKMYIYLYQQLGNSRDLSTAKDKYNAIPIYLFPAGGIILLLVFYTVFISLFIFKFMFKYIYSTMDKYYIANDPILKIGLFISLLVSGVYFLVSLSLNLSNLAS